MLKKKQTIMGISLIQSLGIGSAVGMTWLASNISASALNIPSYPAFDKSCSETKIREYLTALNDPGRTEFVLMALSACEKEPTPIITKLLQSQDENDRSLAAYWLAMTGNNKKEALPVLITSLKAKNVEIRSRTAYVLGKIGANEATSALSEALNDRNMAVRNRAALALVQMKADSPNLIPALINALKDRENYVRSQAAQALGTIGKNASSIVPALVDILKKDQDEQVRFDTVVALGNIGKEAKDAVPALLALFSSPNEKLGNMASSTIGRIGNAKEVIPILLTKFQDKNPLVRSNAARCLLEFKQDSQQIIPFLVAALKNPDFNIHSEATNTLGRFGALSITALVEALRDKNERVRANSALAFLKMSLHDSSAVFDPKINQRAIPALQEVLKDSSEVVRYRAILALKEFDRDGKNIPALPKAALADRDKSVRAKAAITLFGSDSSLNSQIIPILISAFDDERSGEYIFSDKITELGKQAIPFLIQSLKDSSDRIRAKSASFLGRLGNDAQAAIPSLVMALKDTDSMVRIEAMSALQKIVVNKRNIVLALSELLLDEDSKVCNKAAHFLKAIGAEAVPELVPKLMSKKKEVRASSAKALGVILENTQINKDSSSAIFALSRLLKDSDNKVRYQAVVALNRIPEKPKYVIPILIETLKDKDNEDVRHQSALVLRQVAKNSIPNLVSALKDSNAHVRKGAAFALGNVVRPPPTTVITALKTVVNDPRNNLDVRQVAASTLEGFEVNMQPFFTKHGLITPKNAVCPSLIDGWEEATFEFDIYMQRCLLFRGKNTYDSGANTLFNTIRRLFRGR